MNAALKYISIAVTAVFCICSFFMGIFILNEGYYLFDPAIDTKFTENYSEENFDKIIPGMDTSEVIKLIGKPFKQNLSDNSLITWSYSTDGKFEKADFAWLSRKVTFNKTGKVKDTQKAIYYD